MTIPLQAGDIIWKNGRLATMAPHHSVPYGLLVEHDLITRADKILAIVPPSNYQPPHHCKIIDLNNQLVTPGMIDCHTHLVFGGSRACEWEQRLKGISYQEISAAGGGINSTVAATRHHPSQLLLERSQQRLHALMKEGITTIEMKSGYGLNLESEEKILHIIQQLQQSHEIEISPTLLAAHTVPNEFKDQPDSYVDLVCQQIIPRLWRKKLFEAVDVFCEKVGFSLQQTERIFQTAQQLGIPIKGHVEQLSNLGGAKLVARFNGLSVDHIEYVDQQGVQALQHSQTVAVLLPGAFYFLKEKQLPPVDLLREFKIPIAISTDFNPGTSPFASIRLMMNMACVQFGLTPEEAWLGVTRHAAQALNRQQTHGQLAPGFMADFLVWDTEYPVEIFYELGHNPLTKRIFRGKTTF